MRSPLAFFGRGVGHQAHRISWWAPYWFHIPRTWHGLRFFIRTGPILRVIGVSAGFGAVIVVGLKIAMPAIQLPPVWKMLLALPVPYAYVLSMMLVNSLIPSRIMISKDRIHIMTGQSHWIVKVDSIRSARIVVFATNRIRLRIFYVHKDEQRSRVFAVAKKVNLESLFDLLPVKTEVWDAQDRYHSLHVTNA